LGSKINRAMEIARDFDADIYLVGHTHELLGFRKIKLVNDGDRMKEKKVIFALTGSFLKTYSLNSHSYGEASLYPPPKTGIVSILIDAERKDLHVIE